MDNDPTHLDLDASVVDWVIEHPESVPIFERFGIDYSCAGKSLESVCRQRGLDPQFVLDELRRVMS